MSDLPVQVRKIDDIMVYNPYEAYTRGGFSWTDEFGKPGMPVDEEAPYEALSPTDCTLELAEHISSVAATLRTIHRMEQEVAG
ncbi:MAG TPA: hypothetical protein P5168_03145, partial [Candidatus Methanomethylicus sp.]|nr:hypothetical protein [Candidatus Methanomethylicus sp.]